MTMSHTEFLNSKNLVKIILIGHLMLTELTYRGKHIIHSVLLNQMEKIAVWALSISQPYIDETLFIIRKWLIQLGKKRIKMKMFRIHILSLINFTVLIHPFKMSHLTINEPHPLLQTSSLKTHSCQTGMELSFSLRVGVHHRKSKRHQPEKNKIPNVFGWLIYITIRINYKESALRPFNLNQ